MPWGTGLHDYQARIFGGGNMLAGFKIETDSEYAEVDYSPVGDSNAALAFSQLLSEGVSILEADVGEQGYRKLEFDPQTGKACVQFFPVRSAPVQVRQDI